MGQSEIETNGMSSGKVECREVCGEVRDGLQMTPELMLDLARKAAELVVGRIESLPGEDAWDGEFQQELRGRLMEDPPEDGRPAVEVIEQAAREILPVAARLDHPRCFAFVPSSPTWPGCWPTSWPPGTTSTNALG